MTEQRTPTADTDFKEVTRMWGGGWRRYVFPGFWLVYLGQTAQGVANTSHGAAAVIGYLIIVAFAACYLVALPLGWTGQVRGYWILYGICIALTIAETTFAHADALVFCVYIAVLTVAPRRRWSLVTVVAMSVLVGLLPRMISSWGGRIDWNAALSVLLVSLAMFGFFTIVSSNIELSAARAEVARLAAENERSRIARDLHDLLGQSLTTITVKAGLARRLGELGDTERSLVEITEVERLSRRTLGDVRAAVAGQHEMTLVGELATAREVLRAAAITAELPGSVDVVDPELSELFGWAVREGVTNVVRHSRASHCQIELGPRWMEIIDDGRGGAGGSGSGLTGLRERVRAMDGVLTAERRAGGWRLRVEVPAVSRPSEPETIPSVVLP